MNKMRSAITIVLSTALVCANAFMARAQSGKTNPNDRLSKRQSLIYHSPGEMRITGVDVVQLVNRAEAVYRHAHGDYASWDELVRSGAVSETQRRWPQAGLTVGAGPEVTPGWMLAVIPSADGKSYELSLHSVHEKCGSSFFSDQSGLIYEGNMIGCPVEFKPVNQ